MVSRFGLEYFLHSWQPFETFHIPESSTKRQCCYKYAVSRTRPSIHTMLSLYRFLPLNFFDSTSRISMIHPEHTSNPTFCRPLLLRSALSSLFDTAIMLEAVRCHVEGNMHLDMFQSILLSIVPCLPVWIQLLQILNRGYFSWIVSCQSWTL